MADFTGIEDNLSQEEEEEEGDVVEAGYPSDSETDFEDDNADIHAPNAPAGWNLPFRPGDTSFAAGSSFSSNFGVDQNSSPLAILKKFVTTGMIQNVCDESNKLVTQVKLINSMAFPNWKDVTVNEMWRFIALNLAMGIVKKHSIKCYWSTNSVQFTPFFGEHMSRNRFEAILSSLHLHDKTQVHPNCTDRFIKLGPFITDLVKNVKSAVLPGEFLCLDESLLGYKGRLSFKQFNPMKRARFGILFYILCDCKTGMILDVLPYQGKSTNLPRNYVNELQRGGATVASLMEPYLNRNHKLIADNYFNSPKLANHLLDNGTHLLGTVQKRRKEMPKMLGKLKNGEITTYSDGRILLERWQDRREVVMINTFLPHSMSHFAARNPHNSRQKPASVLLYNKNMGIVDIMDKTIKPFSSNRKTYKWYKRVFFYLVDVGMYNAYRAYLFHQTGKRTSYKDFVLNAVDSIMIDHPCEQPTRGRPSKVARPETKEFHIPIKNGKADCTWCKKNENKRSQTQYKCTVCGVRLCIQKGDSCYAKYHESLKKKGTKQVRDPLANIMSNNRFIASAPLSMSAESFRTCITSTPIEDMELEDDTENSSISQSLLA